MQRLALGGVPLALVRARESVRAVVSSSLRTLEENNCHGNSAREFYIPASTCNHRTSAQRAPPLVKYSSLNNYNYFHAHLVYVYPLKVHFHDGDARVGRVLDVAELRVPRVDVDDGHGGRELPLVAPAAVEVGADPLDGAGVLVGAAGAVEGKGRVRVVGVADADVVHGLGVVQLVEVGAVRQPRVVPVVDPVEIGRVVEPLVS